MHSRLRRPLATALAALVLAHSPAQEPAKPGKDEPVPGENTPLTVEKAAPAPLPSPSLRDLINSLTPADVQEAMNALKASYVHAPALTDDEMAKATLEGLVARLGTGARLQLADAREDVSVTAPFRQETIKDAFGYVRLSAMNSENLAALDAALKGYTEKKLPAVILDLRATPASSDYDLAAQVINRFCAKGKPLFTLKKASGKGQDRLFTSASAPVYEGLIIAVVDADTAGAPEVVAASLRLNTRCLVVGENTQGRAVEYGDVLLGNGRKLRVATGEIVLAQDASLFPGGVKPDIAMTVDQKTLALLFKAADKDGLAPLIFENERPRFNEAALVAGTNPSIESDEERGDARPGPDGPLADTMLQKAVDLVTTISVYEQTQAVRGK